MRPIHVRSGDRFNRWTVIEEVRPPRHKHRQIKCQCDCGTVRTLNLQSIRRGKSTSCGCRQSELAKKHGMHSAPEYSIWAGIKQRCFNPKGTAFHDYGGRGISVCDRWVESFENFYADMGPRPSPRHSVERQDVDGNYEPDNCFWATPDVQARNKRGTKWKRVLLMLAGDQAGEVARMVSANVPDAVIAEHVARVYRPVSEAA